MYLSVIKRDEDIVDGRPRWQIARSLFRAAERGDVIILASSLVQAEVMGNGEVRSSTSNSAAAELVRDWFRAEWIEWCDLDRLIARKASELSRTFQLRGGDAVHLASAIRLNAGSFMSNDKGFQHAYAHTVDGVEVVKPKVLWQETLGDSTPT